MRRSVLLLLLAATGLSGCEDLGIPTPASRAAAKVADAKAIGSACRHAGRAIEDCYQLNKKADKAAVFAGWREMNDYMRENNIGEVKPVVPIDLPKPPPPAAKASEDEHGDAEQAATGDGKAHDAPDDGRGGEAAADAKARR